MKKDADEDYLYKELDNVISKVKPAHSRTRLRFKPDLKIAVEDCVCDNKVPIERFDVVCDKNENIKTEDQSDSEVEPDQWTGDVSVRLRSTSESGTPDKKEDNVSSVNENCMDISPIWCLDCQDNIIVVGCASGVVEVWDASTGKLKVCIMAQTILFS